MGSSSWWDIFFLCERTGSPSNILKLVVQPGFHNHYQPLLSTINHPIRFNSFNWRTFCRPWCPKFGRHEGGGFPVKHWCKNDSH
jgi:hypothetical protein